MITIRFRDATTIRHKLGKPSTPATEWVKTLPKDTEWEVTFTMFHEDAILEEIKVNGQTLSVQGILNTNSQMSVLLRLLLGSVRVSKS